MNPQDSAVDEGRSGGNKTKQKKVQEHPEDCQEKSGGHELKLCNYKQYLLLSFWKIVTDVQAN